MPQRELTDFNNYWRTSMLTVINGSLSNRPPGGSGIEVGGIKGVDYESTLIPWCKGNSVSVDQIRLDTLRQLFSLLIERARNRLTLIDHNELKNPNINKGLHYNDLRNLYGRPQAAGYRRIAAFEYDGKWKDAEAMFINLLQNGHITLFETKDTQAKIIQEEIMQKINMNLHQTDWHGTGNESQWMDYGICFFLSNTQKKGGHIRLNELNGWETYIRDHWGAPAGITGIIPGNLSKKHTGKRTMPIPLHLVLPETMARAIDEQNSTDTVWGKNQSDIRRGLADKASHLPPHDTVNLNVYYGVFSKYNAGHMADTFFLRNIDDKTSARFELIEIQGSKPKQWNVKFEPEFLRWRMNQRNRKRNTGGVP